MSIRRKNVIMKEVSMVMLEEGKVLTKGEYDRLPTVPIRSQLILGQFGNWARMINLMEVSMPAMWAELKDVKPKVEEDFEDYNPLEKLASKTTSKAL